MSEESLRELLARVHERLSQTPRVDEESRRLLATLTDDIDRALDASAGAQGPSFGDDAAARGQAAPADDPTATGPRVEALAVRFEAEHPQLAAVLRQLMDALGKAGI